jgi:DNA-binding HxlR family transcriptional regulator
MSTYDGMDAAILLAIRQGCRRFYEIHSQLKHLDFRLTDRRLQSLRKRGKIAYRKGLWQEIKP